MTKFDEIWISNVYKLFDEFYKDTQEFRTKCMENEEFWRANHWNNVAQASSDEPRPVTPVLFSTLENMLADIMDNYPEAVILGEEPGDDKLAVELGQYVNYILKRRNYKAVFRDKCRAALKKGASVQEFFWDKDIYNGFGDINIRNWDIKNFLWDDRCENIQEGRGCFKFSFYPMSWFEARYKKLVPSFQGDGYKREGFTDKNEVMLMEYWYKVYDPDTGKETVHMAKLAGKCLLEASETELPEGMYDHGKYPFIVETFFPIEGKAVGLGVIDIFKNLQVYADKLDQIIVKNALMSGKMKMLVNKNSELDEAALADWSCEVVRGNRIDDGSVRWFQPAQLSPSVMAHYNSKLDSIRDESGQTAFNRGEVGKGITAASAILALQETGSKRSRLLISGLYDGFESLIRGIVELMIQSYTETRYARLKGENGDQVVGISGSMLQRENGTETNSIDFDISVNVQKQTPYKTLYQNELALELLRSGIVLPEEALDMMTFDGKEAIVAKVLNREAESNRLSMPSMQKGNRISTRILKQPNAI